MRKWHIGYIPDHVIQPTEIGPIEIAIAEMGYVIGQECFGLDLYFMQSYIMGMVCNPHVRFLQIIAPTRYGKSMTLGAGGLFLGGNSHLEVNIGSITKDKSAIIMDKMTDLILQADPVIVDGLIGKDKIEKLRTKVSQDGLGWADGGKVGLYTLNESRKNTKTKGMGAIGKGGDVTMLDESALISDPNYSVARRVIVEKPDSRFIEISNPHLKNHFFKTYHSKLYTHIHIDEQTALEEGRFTVENQRIAREGMTLRDQIVYFDCLFVDEDTDKYLFTESLINKNATTDRTLPVGNAFAGLDTAWRGDDDIILTIIKGKTILPCISFKPQQWGPGVAKDVAQRIIAKCLEYNVLALTVDVGGVGAMLYEFLTMVNLTGRIEIIAINFSSSPTKERIEREEQGAVAAYNKRAEMYLDYQKALQDNKILLQEPDDVREELIVMEYKFRNGKYQLGDKESFRSEIGHSPDKADSHVLALHAKTLRGIQLSYDIPMAI